MLNHIALQKIEEAIRSGAWDDLPNKGQPLNLEEDAHLPEELRLGHKILRDANVVPDWIEERKRLEITREKLRARLERFALQVPKAASKYRRAPKLITREEIEAALREFNREVMTWSLKAPRHATPLRAFDIAEELRAVEERRAAE